MARVTTRRCTRAREREREGACKAFLLVITCNAVKRGHYKLSRGPASRVGRSTASPTAWPGVRCSRGAARPPTRPVVDGCSRASSSSASLTRRRRGRRRTDYSRVREYADPSTRVRRNTPGGGSRAERISQASAQPQEVHPPLSIIVSHEAQDRTVKLTVAGKTAVVGRRGLSRYLALSTVSVLRHVHRCTSTHPVTAHRSPAPPPPRPRAPRPGRRSGREKVGRLSRLSCH